MPAIAAGPRSFAHPLTKEHRMQILDHPVGTVGGSAADASRVRELLDISGFDGVCGEAPARPLEARIRDFQRQVVGLRVPDGRIDPGGETIGTLLAEARKQVFLYDRASRQYDDPRVTMAFAVPVPDVVIGNIQKPHLISQRTIGALQLLGYCCGLTSMTITEGIRTYEMMASYFLRKITDGSSGVRGEGYRKALQILADNNDGKPYAAGAVPQEHITAVADLMRERCEATKTRVSMHVVSEDDYRKLNVIDLGWNSNPMLKGKTMARVFARLLDSLHLANKRADTRFVRTYYPPHHLNPVLNSPFGREIKIENAWHLEFEVGSIPPELG